MTDTVTKLNYGVLIGPPVNAVTVPKINYGVVIGPPAGIVITKMNFGVIIDTLTPGATARRRQMINT